MAHVLLIRFPWQQGKYLACDVIVVNILDDFHISLATLSHENVAEIATEKNILKYSRHCPENINFQPVALETLETLEPLNSSASLTQVFILPRSVKWLPALAGG